MKNFVLIIFLFLILIFSGCSASKSNSHPSENNKQMKFVVTKVQDEKDGQTIFLNDHKGRQYITIISPVNGNWIELLEGDKISLFAEEIMKSDPPQIIAKNIKILNRKESTCLVKISTNKNIYSLGEPIILSMTVQNTSQAPYTFLPWGTPLENDFTNDCMEVKFNGAPIPYIGIMVSRIPPTEKDYVTLQFNETSTGKVKLIDGYQLSKKGLYTIQFKEAYQGLPASNILEIKIN